MTGLRVQIPTELVKRICDAQRIVVLTGAGISAESGVPTFREAQSGLWQQYNPRDLATAAAFERHPKLVWRWYHWRRQLLAKAEPNDGHRALVSMEDRCGDFTLITQNVDGLHARAGSQNILELHGNINRFKCFQEDDIVHDWEETDEEPPKCRNCGAFLRPDVVWFGESLAPEILQAAFEAATCCDLLFSVGTSSVVQPAASLPYETLRSGGTVVEVNPETTSLSPCADYVLTGPAGEILPTLTQTAWKDQ